MPKLLRRLTRSGEQPVEMFRAGQGGNWLKARTLAKGPQKGRTTPQRTFALRAAAIRGGGASEDEL